jgi:DNA-binding response OmpR family regulator
MLPGMNGEEVLPRIKNIPTIIVSAKAGISDKVNLLLSGAADYITKPFDIDELLARITVALRKSDTSVSSESITFREITIDLVAHGVMVSDVPVKCTKTEFAILKILMQNPSQVVAKSVILDRISIDTPDCVESSLKVHISNIRRKLKEVNGTDYIEAVWGIGFKMRED